MSYAPNRCMNLCPPRFECGEQNGQLWCFGMLPLSELQGTPLIVKAAWFLLAFAIVTVVLVLSYKFRGPLGTGARRAKLAMDRLYDAVKNPNTTDGSSNAHRSTSHGSVDEKRQKQEDVESGSENRSDS